MKKKVVFYILLDPMGNPFSVHTKKKYASQQSWAGTKILRVEVTLK